MIDSAPAVLHPWIPRGLPMSRTAVEPCRRRWARLLLFGARDVGRSVGRSDVPSRWSLRLATIHRRRCCWRADAGRPAATGAAGSRPRLLITETSLSRMSCALGILPPLIGVASSVHSVARRARTRRRRLPRPRALTLDVSVNYQSLPSRPVATPAGVLTSSLIAFAYSSLPPAACWMHMQQLQSGKKIPNGLTKRELLILCYNNNNNNNSTALSLSDWLLSSQ